MDEASISENTPREMSEVGEGAAVQIEPAASGNGDLPDSLLAVRLWSEIREIEGDAIFVTRSERRAEALAGILAGLDPSLDVLHFPAWDCVPYDRASPSRHAMGERMAVLTRLSLGHENKGEGADAVRRRIVLTSPDAIIQRVPPRKALAGARIILNVGEAFSEDALEQSLLRAGYLLDERVDEPGEAAFHGATIDLFPADGEIPYRLEHAEGRIEEIRSFDPVTQLSIADLETLTFFPASEVILSGREGGPAAHFPGIEHELPGFYDRLETLLDYCRGAQLIVQDGVESRLAAAWEQIEDAHRIRGDLRAPAEDGRPPRPSFAPERLYLTPDEWKKLSKRFKAEAGADDAAGDAVAVPRFAARLDAARAFRSFMARELEAGRRIVLAAPDKAGLAGLVRRTRARNGGEDASAPEPVAASGWAEVLALPPGTVATMVLKVGHGFVDPADDVVLITAADVLGSRAENGGQGATSYAQLLDLWDEFHLGDAVIHMDHGMGALRGLEFVEGAGARQETVALEYAGEARLMVPLEQLGKLWRYGADAETVTLDRLDGESWNDRRETLMGEIGEAAQGLAKVTSKREQAKAPVLRAPRAGFERFISRFAYALTADQASATRAVMEDLASGRPMNRLVCGDVGFGKTEVALRAAAVAALAGMQVALIAPTTVLARQHYESFRRRFAGFGIEVAHLSRLVSASEASRVKQGLAEGSIRVVVGTHALAGRGVRFKELGLLIVDEEQRLGTAVKTRLASLGRSVHVLRMSATPIPRTLQGALVGLQDLSIIATPPARRQPIRTFRAPFDPVTVRQALIREKRRGGQSFLVCPQIRDIAPMAARLAELVPDLTTLQAHGGMGAEEIDEAMIRFAEGDGDVLLATNIIESGLDVPRANTILIWRADRFGLSQLHQMRGRVGRSRLRGIAYLLTDPKARLSEATEDRLRTLEAFDRLGSGFAISARDLDLRGAGDLLGDEQSGHVKLAGIGLYQHLLSRALREARGQAPEPDYVPELRIGAEAFLPEDYVAEPELRLNLYARLARLTGEEEITAFEDEIEDRFGNAPDPAAQALKLARLRAQCLRLGIERAEVGPQAVAITFHGVNGTDRALADRIERSGLPFKWREERLIVDRPTETDGERMKLLTIVLRRLESGAPAPGEG
ncbi:transcription-repair coupling factor (superfamily II helicase) [Faunimonas pinastri]|uniref:Transcription-repair-coupling factor n=1 Tax=Faunimonas pinastri TaxID=1855383 RepID=A0A1H8Z194_9HYPH|nr:TRCF domain-containing protein [Faunimonas pinastri]SEP58225.1 transcription-repair coupling factor (superfamily II helicase) [Faunimonas pinastri]